MQLNTDQKKLLQLCQSGIKDGTMKLVLTSDGLGGTYFVVGQRNRHVAVFKPSGEEVGTPGNPKGYRDVEKSGFPPGHGYRREIAAYMLDHGHSAGVPTTVEAELLPGEVGSLQLFVHCDGDGSYGPGKYKVDSVHRVGIFDIRTLNCDRHEGNLLNIRDRDTDEARCLDLVPIDHGYILPEGGLQDLEFDWLYYPQSKIPFCEETLQYIASLDADADVALLSSLGFSEEVTDNLKAATLVLQHGASHGYTLREIGEFCRRQQFTQPSGLESALAASRVDLDQGGHVNWEPFTGHMECALVMSGDAKPPKSNDTNLCLFGDDPNDNVEVSSSADSTVPGPSTPQLTFDQKFRSGSPVSLCPMTLPGTTQSTSEAACHSKKKMRRKDEKKMTKRLQRSSREKKTTTNEE
eukprot:PhF_6_TR3398/c4_g1_i1/m.4876